MKKNIAVNLVFLLSLVVLGALMSWPGDLLDRFVQNDREENYVFTLTLQLNELQRSLKSESTEQRISIASGSRENLREYSAAVKRSNENLARLWALTDGRPQYRARLSEMLPLIEQRRVLLQGGLDKRIQDPRGRELIREIRRRISDLKDQLLKDLRDSSAGQQQSLRGIRTLMVAKSVLVALLFTTVFVLLRREIARRAREEEVLTRHRDHLDDLVACRTAELVKANELLKNEMEIRKKAEFALHNLNRHTAFIREEERRTISRDIHDEIGQALTALKLDLAWIERKFLPDNAEFLDRTASMKSFLDRLIGKVQNIISELRPPLLDSLGVVDAIHWQTHEFRRRNGIACELSIQENINDLDMHVATTVIRIIMEALTNVSRHAQATKVRIEVKFSGNRLLLEISDNGRGLTPEEIASPTSYGLLGMRERAALCDGTLSFATPPGGGTTVCASIPVERQQEEF